jgi:hypothetical protein
VFGSEINQNISVQTPLVSRNCWELEKKNSAGHMNRAVGREGWDEQLC